MPEHTEKKFDSSLMAEEAKKVLIEEQTAREKRCSAEIEEILKRNKCKIDAVVYLAQNQVIPQIRIMSL